jgi:hypothetical protein
METTLIEPSRAFFCCLFPSRALHFMEGFMAVDIGAPTMRGVQNNLMSYGAGVISGLAYNVVSGFTGSGLIGGAISAAVAGSIARKELGEMIAVNAGFRTGSVGMQGLGLGNLGGIGGRRNGNGNAKQPAINLI